MSRSVSIIVTASSDDVFTRVFSSESIDGGPPIELETCSVRPAVQLVRNVLRRVDADVAGVTDAPQNDPVDMVVAKVDKSTGRASALGKGTLAGAEFTVKFYAGQYTEDNLPAQATRTWVLKTDKNGKAFLDESSLVGGDELFTDTSGVATIPLGTVSIQETKAPTGYLLTDNEVRVQNITSDGTLETVRTFVEPDEEHPTVEECVRTV